MTRFQVVLPTARLNLLDWRRAEERAAPNIRGAIISPTNTAKGRNSILPSGLRRPVIPWGSPRRWPRWMMGRRRDARSTTSTHHPRCHPLAFVGPIPAGLGDRTGRQFPPHVRPKPAFRLDRLRV